MNKVKFISVKYFKSNTTVQGNVDDDIILPFIYRAQDIDLQQVLGTTFYNRLKEAVINNDLNADEENLLRTYIQPMLVDYSLYYLIPHISYKFTNKAVSQQNSEFSNPSDLSDIKYIRQSVLDMAEFYKTRLVKYLCDYSNLFAEYNNPDDKENLSKSGKSYFNGLYIPKRDGSDTGLRTYNDPSE
jgi:hypothetical protein